MHDGATSGKLPPMPMPLSAPFVIVARLGVASGLVVTLACGPVEEEKEERAARIGDGDLVGAPEDNPLENEPEPVVCEDDALEDNDTRATATLIEPGDEVEATFCGGDDDFFAVTVEAGCVVHATVARRDASGTAPLGDVDLLLTDDDGVVLGAAQTLAPTEELEATSRVDGHVVARVRGGPRDALAYSLVLGVACP
jgi:hypothetical protein